MRRGTRVLLPAVAVLAVALAPAVSAAIVEQDPAHEAVVRVHGEYRFTSNSTSPVLGRPDGTMRLTGPDGFLLTGTPNEQGFSSVLLRTLCPAEPCGAPARNGAYTVVEERGQEAGETRTFFLRIGGLPVVDLTAEVEGRTVTARWRPGPEPDVTGWTAQDDQGAIVQIKAVQDAPSTAEKCPDGICSATFPYAPTVGGERTFVVRALRPCGVEDCADVPGAATTVSATLPPAVESPPSDEAGAPSGAPPPTVGAGTASGPGSLAGGFGPKLGQPKLPPLPQNVPPAVAAPLPDGTFDPTLDYGRQLPEVAESELVPEAAGREGTQLISTGGFLGDEQVMRSIAGALVLLMSGAHLRAWLNKSGEDALGL